MRLPADRMPSTMISRDGFVSRSRFPDRGMRGAGGWRGLEEDGLLRGGRRRVEDGGGRVGEGARGVQEGAGGWYS